MTVAPPVRALLAIGRDANQFFPADRLGLLRSLVDLRLPEGRLCQERYSEQLAASRPEIVITGWGSPCLTAALWAAHPQVRYVCHVAGTVRSVVERRVVEAGLLVTNWGDSISRTVAEAALLGILSCLRRTTHVDLLMHRDSGWFGRDQRGSLRSLFHRRVGLHGFGQVAQALVRLLAPFQCAVAAFDPFVPASVFEACGVRQMATLEELYATSEVVSIHCPGGAATYHSVGAPLLGLMKDGSCLINTARGSVIDTEALARELATGRVSAALDVFEDEPLPEASPLRGLPNCQLTCHTAGPTVDRVVDAGDAALANIARYVEGGRLVGVVDADQYERHS